LIRRLDDFAITPLRAGLPELARSPFHRITGCNWIVGVDDDRNPAAWTGQRTLRETKGVSRAGELRKSGVCIVDTGSAAIGLSVLP